MKKKKKNDRAVGGRRRSKTQKLSAADTDIYTAAANGQPRAWVPPDATSCN